MCGSFPFLSSNASQVKAKNIQLTWKTVDTVKNEGIMLDNLIFQHR